ncbi:MAG TPA: hypothetical protein VGL39_27740 [Jatrophihabitantaceae bacterium]|jgi:hypothetical protein
MTGPEHIGEAERLLNLVETCDEASVKEWGALNLAAAQVHATLAQVSYLREIGDQLDTLPRPRTVPLSAARRPVTIDRSARAEAAKLLESMAIGDDGEERQRTVDRLVANTHLNARDIAHEALAMALIPERVIAVLDAMKVLGLDGAL